jgi:hypothetical protein
MLNNATCPSTYTITPSDFSVEVWNEPNNFNYWSPVCDKLGNTVSPGQNCPANSLFPNKPEEYVAHKEYFWLLKEAYAGVKDGSAQQVRVVGIDALQPNAISMHDWTSDLYGDACPTSPCSKPPPWDVVSLHPYPNYSRDGSCPAVSAAFLNVQDVVDVMINYGDGSKDVWLTEFGWSDESGNCPETSAKPYQSDRLSEALTYADLPYNVTLEVWWLSDNTPLQAPWNGTCPSTSWKCGMNLLEDDLTVPTSTPNVYDTLKNAP